MKHQEVSADELFAAMRLGSESIVRQLVLRDALVAHSRDESGVSAILHCLYDWDLSMLEVLLASSPGLDIFEAAALGKTERVEALLNCMPELARSWSADGVTALHLACFYGQEEAAQRLLEAGADPSAHSANEQGSTPLHEAAGCGHTDIVLLLLAHGAEVDATNNLGWTALHLSASQGYQDVVESLLRSKPHFYRTEEGQTARDLALANGHTTTARVLDCLVKG
ncbi:MAG TPA: ankyrin repeat domain-containing protein [Terriglobales bacterium]|nr:ankyrin repeat domain-containing protein [Terriglobales bacterium]